MFNAENAIELFFMEEYPSETADFSFIIFSNTNSWGLCLGSLQIKCWKDSGGLKGHSFLLPRSVLCFHCWWILSLRLFLGIKHLAFVAGSCYKEPKRRFNYCHSLGIGNKQQLSPDVKGRKSCSNHGCPELHTGDLMDCKNMNLERKRKMRAWSTPQDRHDLGNRLPVDVLLSATKISLVFLLGRVFR